MNPNSSYFNFKTSNSTSKVQNSKFQIPKSKSKNPNSKFKLWIQIQIQIQFEFKFKLQAGTACHKRAQLLSHPYSYNLL